MGRIVRFDPSNKKVLGACLSEGFLLFKHPFGYTLASPDTYIFIRGGFCDGKVVEEALAAILRKLTLILKKKLRSAVHPKGGWIFLFLFLKP
jgi:hypothetical protein